MYKYQENNKTELKKEMIDDLSKEIIAFLNTSGGTIYVGVDDDGNIYPYNNPKES